MDREEIERLIASCERAYDLRKESLEPWETAALAMTIACGVSQIVEIIAWATDDIRLSSVDITGRSFNAFLRGPRHALQMMSVSCRTHGVLAAVAERWVLLDAMARELYRRVPNPVGQAMMNPSSPDLLKSLQINSLKDFDSFGGKELKESRHLDLRHDLVIKAFDILRTMGRRAGPQLRVINLPAAEVDRIEIGLSGQRWVEWPRFQAAIINHILGPLDLIFWGPVERVPEALRQASREVFRKRKRAKEHRDDDIRTQIHQEVETPDEKILWKEVLVRAEHENPKVARYLRDILSGYTEEEASERNGIPRSTARDGIVRLKKTIFLK